MCKTLIWKDTVKSLALTNKFLFLSSIYNSSVCLVVERLFFHTAGIHYEAKRFARQDSKDESKKSVFVFYIRFFIIWSNKLIGIYCMCFVTLWNWLWFNTLMHVKIFQNIEFTNRNTLMYEAENRRLGIFPAGFSPRFSPLGLFPTGLFHARSFPG